MHRHLLILIIALSLAACGADQPAPTRLEPTPSAVSARSPAPRTPESPASAGRIGRRNTAYSPRFAPAACPFDTEGAQVECGYLEVPENRAAPAGPTLRLAVAIIRSSADTKAPDPLIYLEGGPGGSALYDAAYWFDSAFLERRDIILIDQRGTGYSLPSLNCPELESPDVVTMDDEQAAARACSRRLRRQGIDLKQYNSAAVAADLADLRSALRLDLVNLFGVSYGTRAALTMLRDNPEGVRSVILDSSYPPEVDAYTEEAANAAAAIETLLEGCAADRRCSRAYPDLDKTFYSLVNRLNRRPASIERTDPDTGEPYEDTLDGDMLVDSLVGWLYDTALIPALPRVIAAANSGDFQPFVELLDGPVEDEPTVAPVVGEDVPNAVAAGSAEETGDIADSEGMFYSVECREELIFGDLAQAKRELDRYPKAVRSTLLASVEQMAAICRGWGSGRARAVEERPVTSDVPALVLAGEYDPVTPPRWGATAASHLSRSIFLEFPGVGHGAIFAADCPEQIALAFLEKPLVAPATACIGRMGGPRFELP